MSRVRSRPGPRPSPKQTAPPRRRADHPNLLLARALWAAVADGNAATIRRSLHPDVVWRSVGRNPRAGEYRGPDGVLDYLAGVGEAVDGLASTLGAIYANDDGAIVCYHTSAQRGAKRLEMDYFLRLRFVDGRVLEGLLVPVDQRENDEFWR